MYELPEINQKTKARLKKVLKNKELWISVSMIALFIALGFVNKVSSLSYIEDRLKFLYTPTEKNISSEKSTESPEYRSDISYEQAIIDTVKSASPSVVSIVISKDLPVYEQQWINPFGDLGPGFNIQIPQYVQKGTESKEIGAGSGFIVSSDGLVLTNKHVVLDTLAEYTVLTNDGQKYPAKVMALDPVQDLAVIKIQQDGGKIFPAIKLGDSDGIQIGQGTVAIGNALGQFSNTVSVGIVSGLERTISASDQAGSFSETLQNIIQTDAAINSGNSGGPLLNLKGEVIGINTAMAQGAENIGFAIPINTAKRAIDQVEKNNKIVYPFLGIRYVLVDSDIKKKYELSVDYGALVLKGPKGEPAVISKSAADKAGIKTNDVVLEANGEKISTENPLSKIVLRYNPGDIIGLKVLRGDNEINIDVELGEKSS